MSIIILSRFSKLKHRILGAYSIPILLLLVAAVLVFFNVKKVENAAQTLEDSNLSVKEIKNFNIEFFRMQKSARGYLLGRENKFFAEYTGAVESTQETANRLQEVISEQAEQQAEQTKAIDEMTQLIEEINENYLVSFELNLAGKTEEAGKLWTANVVPRLERVETLIQDFEKRELLQLQVSQQQQEEALRFLVVIVVLSTGLAATLAVILGLWIASGISQTLNEAASAIAASSTQMSSTIAEQERIANQQASSVNETTNTMEQLGISSRQSAEQIQSVASGANQASTLAEGGTKAVDRTLDGMNTLKNAVQSIAESILRLSEQTQQIGNISTVVSDLANTTNMLALNASVEAVRAGENGKGFSVVANEIRKLADQSKNSANNINSLVSDIQNAIHSTVSLTEEGTKTVDQGVHIAEETTEAFKGVAEAITEIVLNTQQISLNANQQASAIQQMATTMTSINQGVSETATGLSQTKVGVEDLNRVVLNLQAIV